MNGGAVDLEQFDNRSFRGQTVFAIGGQRPQLAQQLLFELQMQRLIAIVIQCIMSKTDSFHLTPHRGMV